MKKTSIRTEIRHRLGLASPGGFTLIEVLVVMAIMVILFAMLFVPISSSIDMVREGRLREDMRSRLQTAMEQIGRELADAQAIYLPDVVALPGVDGKIGPDGGRNDDEYLIIYSNITFFNSSGDTVRYAVLPVDNDPQIVDVVIGLATWQQYLAPEPDIDHPFVLYRLEGTMAKIDTDGDGKRDSNYFGEWHDDTNNNGLPDPGEFTIGYWTSRNALTPTRGTDIPVTETVIVDPTGNGYVQFADGYVNSGKENFPDREAAGTWSDEAYLVPIHGGIEFGPRRIENERLSDLGNRDQTTLTAKYGNWAGLQDSASYSIADATWDPTAAYTPFPLLVNSSELRPRIVVRRWDDGTDSDGHSDRYRVILDTDTLEPGDPADQPDIDYCATLPYVDVTGSTTVDHNMYGLTWDSRGGTVSVASSAGPATISFVVDVADIPDPQEIWDVLATDPTADVTPDPDHEVYTERIIKDATLTAAATLGTNTITVGDASIFSVGEEICITEADIDGNPDPAGDTELKTITNINTGTNVITLSATLDNDYAIGDWVQVAIRDDTTGPTFRKAYSTYEIAPHLVTIDTDDVYDKMVVPDSVRVWVTAHNGTNRSTLEYTRVAFDEDELANIAPGQFAIEAAGPLAPGEVDYRIVKIHFGNGELGTDLIRAVPPSPDDHSTYGAPADWDDVPSDLTEFKIVIAYKVRRNFSTADIDANDYIDVSYSTQAIYNVSLRLQPWRDYEDDDLNNIWKPMDVTKGIQLHSQVPIRNIERY